MTTLYHYRSADGVWRDRCARHIKHTGPYRAVTAPVPSHCRICVECDWSTPQTEGANDQPRELEQVADFINE